MNLNSFIINRIRVYTFDAEAKNDKKFTIIFYLNV